MALGISLMMTRTIVRDNWRVPCFNTVITVIGVIYTPMARVAYIASVIWPRSGSPIRVQLSAHRRLCDLTAWISNFGSARGAAVLAPTPNKPKLMANKSAKATGMAIIHLSRSRIDWGRGALPVIVKILSRLGVS
jgi:hypothetical protein